MKKYNIGYTQYGIEMQEGDRNFLIQQYIGFMGGPENLLNYFLAKLYIREEEFPDGVIATEEIAEQKEEAIIKPQKTKKSKKKKK